VLTPTIIKIEHDKSDMESHQKSMILFFNYKEKDVQRAVQSIPVTLILAVPHGIWTTTISREEIVAFFADDAITQLDSFGIIQ